MHREYDAEGLIQETGSNQAGMGLVVGGTGGGIGMYWSENNENRDVTTAGKRLARCIASDGNNELVVGILMLWQLGFMEVNDTETGVSGQCFVDRVLE